MNRNVILAVVIAVLVVAAYFLAEGRWVGPLVVLAASLLAVFASRRDGASPEAGR